MLCCECGIMRKDRDNPLALSSKKPCQGQTDFGQELERLQADLEAERERTERSRGHLCVKLKHLREEAEREQRKAVRELTARRGCQKHRHSNRHCCLLAKEVSIKGSGGYSDIESPWKEALCLCRRQSYTVLEQLLLTLLGNINSEADSDECLLQQMQHAGHESNIFESFSRKQTLKSSSFNFCQTLPQLTYSGASVHTPTSASNSSKKKTKSDQRSQPVRRDLGAADPFTNAAVVNTCWSSALKICHPPDTPHVQLDDQPPYYAESLGSDESSPSKCMDSKMEVSNFIFTISSFHLLLYCRNIIFIQAVDTSY